MNLGNPVFFDAARQTEPPQSDVLRLLRDLSATWTPLPRLETHAEDMGFGILVIADAVQVREAPSGKEARLTTSGCRWQGMLLRSNPDQAVQYSGVVLTSVGDAYREGHKRFFPESSDNKDAAEPGAKQAATIPPSGPPDDEPYPDESDRILFCDVEAWSEQAGGRIPDSTLERWIKEKKIRAWRASPPNRWVLSKKELSAKIVARRKR